MKKLTTLVAILSVSSLGAQERPYVKDYPQDGVFWGSDWQEAMTEARVRNVPVMLAYLDDSEAGIAIASKVFTERRFIEASRAWVSLPWHPGKGHEVDAFVDSKRVTVCPRFWNLSCPIHVKNSEKMGESWFKIKERPTIMFTNGGLEDLGRFTGKGTVTDVLKAYDKVIEKWKGARVTLDTWEEIEAIRRKGDKYFKDKEWRQAIDTYLRIKKRPEESLQAYGEGFLYKCNLEGEFIFAKAYPNWVKTRMSDEAGRELQKIIRDFKPLKVATKAQQALDEKKHKH